MKTLKNLMIMIFMVTLTACGGGGGGGGGDTPTPDPTPADPTPVTSSDGQAAFYALTTSSSTPLEAVGSPSGAHLVTNQFYVDVVAANSGSLEVGVYQPTCLSGASYKDYALVLLSGTGMSMISIRVLSTGITLETVSYNNNLTQKKKFTSSSVSGTCANGKMTLSNSSVIYSNGKAMVYRDSTNNLYAGLSTDAAYNPTSQTGTDVSSENGGGTEVVTNSYTYWVSGQALLGLAAQGSSGGYEDNGSFFGVYNGAVETAVGDGTASLVLNSTVDVSSYHAIVKGAGAYASRELRSVAGSINGKNIVLGTMSDTCTTDTGSYTYCAGVDMIYTSIEQ